jgi:hypothetical protein
VSAFDSKFSSRLGAIYAAHGETAIALDEYASVINMACLVLIEKDLQQYTDAGVDVTGAAAVISVRRSEVPIRPFKDHVFMVGTTSYHVDDVFKDDGVEYTMTVKA